MNRWRFKISIVPMSFFGWRGSSINDPSLRFVALTLKWAIVAFGLLSELVVAIVIITFLTAVVASIAGITAGWPLVLLSVLAVVLNSFVVVRLVHNTRVDFHQRIIDLDTIALAVGFGLSLMLQLVWTWGRFQGTITI